MSTPKDAARNALEAHDHLRAINDAEPQYNDEDGLPIDAQAWLAWRENRSIPAYDAWVKAMDDLKAALETEGRTLDSRHPFTFRPLCEEILGDKTPSQALAELGAVVIEESELSR